MPARDLPPKDTAVDRATAADRDAADGPFVPRWNLVRRRPTDLRLVSYNVYFDAPFGENVTARARMGRLVRALRADVWALQEVYKTSLSTVVQQFNRWAPLPGGATWYAARGGDNMTVSRFPITVHHTYPTTGGRKASMGLIDLPDVTYDRDLYLINVHLSCCGGMANDAKRQAEADQLVSWLRQLKAGAGPLNLPFKTLLMVVGDMNIVGSTAPIKTLQTGDIKDETTYGKDAVLDWDLSGLADAHPKHNGVGSDDYTWRHDGSSYYPGRLDYLLYSDSVASVAFGFVLNTVTLPADQLQKAGLQAEDVTLAKTATGHNYDHLPLVVDLR